MKKDQRNKKKLVKGKWQKPVLSKLRVSATKKSPYYLEDMASTVGPS